MAERLEKPTMMRVDEDTLKELLAEYPNLMTPDEVGDFLRTSGRTVRRMIEVEKLPYIPVGARNYLIPKSSLIKYLAGC